MLHVCPALALAWHPTTNSFTCFGKPAQLVSGCCSPLCPPPLCLPSPLCPPPLCVPLPSVSPSPLCPPPLCFPLCVFPSPLCPPPPRVFPPLCVPPPPCVFPPLCVVPWTDGGHSMYRAWNGGCVCCMCVHCCMGWSGLWAVAALDLCCYCWCLDQGLEGRAGAAAKDDLSHILVCGQPDIQPIHLQQELSHLQCGGEG